MSGDAGKIILFDYDNSLVSVAFFLKNYGGNFQEKRPIGSKFAFCNSSSVSDSILVKFLRLEEIILRFFFEETKVWNERLLFFLKPNWNGENSKVPTSQICDQTFKLETSIFPQKATKKSSLKKEK